MDRHLPYHQDGLFRYWNQSGHEIVTICSNQARVLCDHTFGPDHGNSGLLPQSIHPNQGQTGAQKTSRLPDRDVRGRGLGKLDAAVVAVRKLV